MSFKNESTKINCYLMSKFNFYFSKFDSSCLGKDGKQNLFFNRLKCFFVFSPIRHQKIVTSHTSIILLDNRTLDLNLEFKSQNWLIINNLVINTWIAKWEFNFIIQHTIQKRLKTYSILYNITLIKFILLFFLMT